MIQEMQKDQMPEEVQISSSPSFESRTDKVQTKTHDARWTVVKGSREGDARRARYASVREQERSRSCLCRGVPADHEAQSQVKSSGTSCRSEDGSAKFTTVGTPACMTKRDKSHQHT